MWDHKVMWWSDLPSSIFSKTSILLPPCLFWSSSAPCCWRSCPPQLSSLPITLEQHMPQDSSYKHVHCLLTQTCATVFSYNFDTISNLQITRNSVWLSIAFHSYYNWLLCLSIYLYVCVYTCISWIIWEYVKTPCTFTP